MDQQNPNTAPERVPTPEEIARLEAQAAKALRDGTTGKGAEGNAPAFVPYVDDVSEPEKPAPVEIEPEGDAEEDEAYEPGPWEKRVNALTPKQWKRVQIAGGVLLGLVAIALLFIGGEELATYRLILAALVSMLVPRYLERVLRKELTVARRAMIVALLVGLAILFVVIGARNGFQFRKAE